jgi:glycosyltransferase involved in cell wall biosynthesis
MLEYATLGIPIVAARLQTMEYYFPNDAIAYFEPGDVSGLAAAIEDLYHHPEKRISLRDRAAEVAADLDPERQRERLFAVIDSLLGPHQRTKTALGGTKSSRSGSGRLASNHNISDQA